MSPKKPGGPPHAYLAAATTGIRHHTTAERLPQHSTTGDPLSAPRPVGRAQLDAVHQHLSALGDLLELLAQRTRTPNPDQHAHLQAARTRLWQSTANVHDAFHAAPRQDEAEARSRKSCRPEDGVDGPPFLTICQRHVTATLRIRQQTTPTDLHTPPTGHTTHCAR